MRIARVVATWGLVAAFFACAGPAGSSEVTCTPDTCCAVKPAWSDTGFATFTGKVAIQTGEPVNPNDYVVTAFHLDSGIPPLDVNWDPPNGLMKRFSGPVDGSGFQRWRGAVLGSVFGLTIDDLGNVYVCQTSVYNSDMVATLPGATSGGVYKIDAVTGQPSTFATLPNVADPNVPSGANLPCLGNITFDCRHRLLFVSNFEDGKIYRLDLSGNVLSTFDPLAPDNGQPGFAPLGERVWAVQWHNDNRIYYSLWSTYESGFGAGPNTIRSVGLDNAGNFVPASDQLEIQPPAFPSFPFSSPVSDISFMANGSILLAEHTMWDTSTPGAHTARLLRYDCENYQWQPSASTYSISAYPSESCAGGVDSDHDTYSGGTHGRVWASGDALHHSINMNDLIYGLQGLPPGGGNTTVSYLIDYDGDITDYGKFSQGDVEVPCPTPVPPDTGVIDGHKFWDQDCDGEWDAGEPGLAGWTIVITGPVTLTATTNGSGAYSFSNLPPGTYTVCELGQFGWQPTSPPNGCFTVTLSGSSIHNLNFANCQLCTSAQSCVPAPANLVAWWPFDEPAGPIAHDVQGLHHGTHQNAPASCAGPSSNALSLNGVNQYVVVPNSPRLNFGASADFTIDAWIRFPTANATQTILDKHVGNVGYELAIANGQLAFAMHDGSTAAVTYQSPNAIPPATWTHVAIVVSRGTNQGRAYVNGVLDGTFIPSSTAPGSISNSTSLSIGRSSGGTRHWKGCIDDVEIFCRALLPAEILDIVTHGKCKQHCSVPAVATYAPFGNTLTINLTICNSDWSAPSMSYAWTIAGLPAGACPVNGPIVISPNSGTVTVPAGGCVNVPVTIQRPPGLGPGQTACYQVTVQNQTTHECFGCTGAVRGGRKLWVDIDTDIHVIPTGSTAALQYVVHSEGEPGTMDDVPAQIVERLDGADASTAALSLNGLPPGEPVITSIRIPGGGVIVVPIDLGYGTCKGVRSDQILLQVDEEGTGAFEDIAVLRVTNDASSEATAVPPPPRIAARISGAPNPFRDATRLELSLQREALVDVRVYDLAGRLVRRLHRGIRGPGISPLIWNGRDDADRAVGPGLYFVRALVDGVRVEARLIRVE